MGRRDEGRDGKGSGRDRIPVHAEPPRGGGTSLGDLLRKAGCVADDHGDEPVAGPDGGRRAEAPGGTPDGGRATSAAAALAGCAKAVVRRERKGHGGRTVTRIEGLGADEGVLAAVAREVARTLGCGCRVDGDAVAVQGDSGERLEEWLRERGVRKVVRGN